MPMDYRQRNLLDRYLVVFCENLQLDQVLRFLESKNILTEYSVEIIQVNSNYLLSIFISTIVFYFTLMTA
jgi:hypothetical protein